MNHWSILNVWILNGGQPQFLYEIDSDEWSVRRRGIVALNGTAGLAVNLNCRFYWVFLTVFQNCSCLVNDG